MNEKKDCLIPQPIFIIRNYKCNNGLFDKI